MFPKPSRHGQEAQATTVAVPKSESAGQLAREVAASIEKVQLPEVGAALAFSPSEIARDVSRQLTAGRLGKEEREELLSPEAQATLPKST
jgi:hypothetical protein